MTKPIRVRYAPSPTGHLHIGNSRTALFNYLFAKHHGGEFIIRIEDTDTKRNIEHGERSQLDNLAWLGIEWAEGPDKPNEKYAPYRQSERLHIYQPIVDELLAQDKAYLCYCTEEELEAEREAQQARGEMPHYNGAHAHLTQEQRMAFEAEGRTPVVRFRVPENTTYSFVDMVKGDISFDSNSLGGDFVIMKRDGMPTYNFAVVVDDHFMAITHILRGDEHIANTPKQLMIYEAMGWEAPTFGHMTLIMNAETGKKLSKRDESILQFIEQYKDLGYLPEAIFNFIGLLGWSPVGEEEVFSKAQFIELFDENRLSKSPASFDANKLAWVNSVYMKKASLDTVVSLALPHLIKAGYVSEDADEQTLEHVKKVIALYHEQIHCGADIVEAAKIFFESTFTLSEEAKEVLSGETVGVVLAAFRSKLEALNQFNEENIKQVVKEVQQETGVKGKNLFMPIRVATSGAIHGPELAKTIEALGKEKCLSHIDNVI